MDEAAVSLSRLLLPEQAMGLELGHPDVEEFMALGLHVIEDVSCIQVNTVRFLIYGHDSQAHVQRALDTPPGDLTRTTGSFKRFQIESVKYHVVRNFTFTYILLIFGVAQDPGFQDKVSLGKKSSFKIKRLYRKGQRLRTGRGRMSHLVPTFQRPLPPLEQISFTDPRGRRVLRVLASCVSFSMKVVNHFPVFDYLRTGETHKVI